jgi:hypothetical protein
LARCTSNRTLPWLEQGGIRRPALDVDLSIPVADRRVVERRPLCDQDFADALPLGRISLSATVAQSLLLGWCLRDGSPTATPYLPGLRWLTVLA